MVFAALTAVASFYGIVVTTPFPPVSVPHANPPATDTRTRIKAAAMGLLVSGLTFGCAPFHTCPHFVMQ